MKPYDSYLERIASMRPEPWPTPEQAEAAFAAFDRVSANLPERWVADGFPAAGGPWEALSEEVKIGYLADVAGSYRVPFERFEAAARTTLGMTAEDKFTGDQEWHLRAQWREGIFQLGLQGADERDRTRPHRYLRDMQPMRESDKQRYDRQWEIIGSGADYPDGWDAPHLVSPPATSDPVAVERAKAQVEALKAADFFSGPERTGGWDDLPHRGKFNTLRHWVDWQGVSRADRAQIIGGQVNAYELAVLHIPEHQHRAAVDLPELIAAAKASEAAEAIAKDRQSRASPSEAGRRHGYQSQAQPSDRHAALASPDSSSPPLRMNMAADCYAGLMNQLEAAANEFQRLARTPEQKALAKGFGEFVAGSAHETIKYLTAEALRPDSVPGPSREDPFDRLVTDLPRHWHEEGRGDAGQTWEALNAAEKLDYLVESAARNPVSFERLADAAERTLGRAPPRELTADELGHLLVQYRNALERQAPARAEPQRPASAPDGAHRSHFQRRDDAQGLDR